MIPALDEELTMTEFARWCHEGLAAAGVRGEILIVDSSRDSTASLAPDVFGAGAASPRVGTGPDPTAKTRASSSCVGRDVSLTPEELRSPEPDEPRELAAARFNIEALNRHSAWLYDEYRALKGAWESEVSARRAVEQALGELDAAHKQLEQRLAELERRHRRVTQRSRPGAPGPARLIRTASSASSCPLGGMGLAR